MTRLSVAVPTGLITGAFVGVMIGGLWLQWQSGMNPNAGHPFVLLTDFPGLRAAGREPWRSAYGIVLAGAVLLGSLGAVLSVSRRLTTYGKAHFQSRREVRRSGLVQPLGAGLVFGKFGRPHRTGRFVCGSYDRFPHALVAAPTRSGKGVGYVIPNTLLFPGSCVIMDVKGEIFEATARHRQGGGDRVFRIAPFDFEHPTHRYNPLERIARIADTDQRFTELSKLASYFLIPKTEKGGASDFVVGARQLFVAAGMLALERGTASIGAIARLLFDTANKEIAFRRLAGETRHAPSATIFLNFSGYSDRTLSSYVSVLDGAGLGLWLNPRIDKVTAVNDFSWNDIRRSPHAIYVVANSDDIPTLAPLLRLMFGELIATMRARIPDPKLEPWPVQIILDEFDQLGPMPIIVQSLKQLAGHGARVSIITQSVPGLESIYSENERLSIEAAAGMKLYIAPNEKKTAGEVAEALGKTTRLALSDSYSQDGKGLLKRSVSRRNEERPLMTADEIRRLAPDKVILIPERQNPILADRIVYYEDVRFKSLVDAQKGPLPYPDPLRDELDTLRAEVAALRDARVVYSPARPSHPATKPAVSTAHLAQTVLGEPEVSAGSVVVGNDVVAAVQAGMDDFDRQLRETKAAAAEIDPS
ncbi:type IV secretory system conjugative DNA transfer family protein [Paracoccus sp. WLY502]|uniref:type IV secretory system conjugative DNA transfer family protein n=1 Tax=Paracoccus yibinensis TaxID=3068891 RepID=UPI002796C6C5|nr:type IV secretory system conjugative DNA transfer family protein [Paracoccus sp. WLY502]MDQ1902056.1 type IV secretory system conjugative DNA transfer family protein [Paracoccus sp. WLY502]